MSANEMSGTKLKILKSAEKLFAQKGFDGARVDDIAENAGVNKALIYYYFKSKNDILEELFRSLINELMEMLAGSIKDIAFMDLNSEQETISQMEIFFDFMDSKRDTIKIMMMESLKESEKRPPLFRFSEIAMSDEVEKIKEIYRSMGLNIDIIDLEEDRVANFFTGMMPLLGFIIFREKWSKYFNIDEKELKRTFYSVFQTTHMAYHKLQLERIKNA